MIAFNLKSDLAQISFRTGKESGFESIYMKM